ncbi:MAG: hypothetical protein M1837_004204 [Sclerophora amabilis]|nr:MAG: hypothetical protein M1837_004204 [Sclerophora amabilis]
MEDVVDDDDAGRVAPVPGAVLPDPDEDANANANMNVNADADGGAQHGGGGGGGGGLPREEMESSRRMSSGRPVGAPANNVDPIMPSPSEQLSGQHQTHSHSHSHSPRTSWGTMAPPPVPSSFSTRQAAHSSHSRRMSKRLSLSFPVHPNTYGSAAHPHRDSPSSSTSATPVEPTTTSTTTTTMQLTPEASPPFESSNFLVALAAQERRVFELKDELRRAESDLNGLKRQWAMHEATRKRNEVRHMEPLQPLNTLLGTVESSGEESSGSTRMSKEQERRRFMAPGAKTSQRKVISGQGHTRALSLLSPRHTQPPSFPQGRTLGERKTSTEGPGDANKESERPPGTGRSSTLPTSATPPVITPPDSSKEDKDAPPKEDLIRSGRQMAEGLKEGLWTFLDDLRQATVGDEAVNGRSPRTPGSTPVKTARKQGSRSSLRSRGGGPTANPSPGVSRERGLGATTLSVSRERQDGDKSALIDVGGTFWKEPDMDVIRSSDGGSKPSTDGVALPRTDPRPNQTEDADDWGNWDSPIPSKPASPRRDSGGSDGTITSSPDHASLTNESSSTPRTSTSRFRPRSDRPDPHISSTDVSKPDKPSGPAPATSTATATGRTNSPQPLSTHIPPTSNGTDPNASTTNPIPWPALAQSLSPVNIHKSASSLMRDWERSLSPSRSHAMTSPEEERQDNKGST